MTRPKRGMDDQPDTSRPPGFPVQSGRIVFGEVYACYKCKGHGWLEPNAKKNKCPMCAGTGWVKRGQLNEG